MRGKSLSSIVWQKENKLVYTSTYQKYHNRRITRKRFG